MSIENKIQMAIAKKRKALLDLLEVSMGSESFLRIRRLILNMMGDRGLEGEIRNILACLDNGRAGNNENAKGVVSMDD